MFAVMVFKDLFELLKLLCSADKYPLRSHNLSLPLQDYISERIIPQILAAGK
jgi:hypothetical protein